MLVVILYMYFAFRTDSFTALLTWGLQGWIATLLVSLPYICLCTWMSCLVDSPFVALFLCYLTVGFPIVILKIASWSVAKALRVENLGWLERLTPWGWKYELLHPDWATAGIAAGMMLAFAGFVFLIAVWYFLRRDL